MKSFVWSIAATVAAVASLSAQETVSPLAVQFGVGFTQGVGHTGRNLDIGWNTSIGAGYNFNRHLATMVDFRTSVMGNTFGGAGFAAPGGTLSVFSVTLDPVVHLMPGGHVDPYVFGGGGLFRRSFGGEYSVNQLGTDIGIGIAIGTKWRGKVFGEAHYDHLYIADRAYSSFLPVTFGYRW